MLRRPFIYFPLLAFLSLTFVGTASADTLTFTELDSATLTVACTVGTCGGVAFAVFSLGVDHWSLAPVTGSFTTFGAVGFWSEPEGTLVNYIDGTSGAFLVVTSDYPPPSGLPISPNGSVSSSFGLIVFAPGAAPLTVSVAFLDLGDTPVASPEPSSVGLLSVGLAALCFMLRKKRLQPHHFGS